MPTFADDGGWYQWIPPSYELLGLTASLTFSTLICAVVAGLMPRLVGDEPNPVVGIRTKATLSSPEAWQLAHQAALPFLRRTVRTILAGLCIQVVIGLGAGFDSLPSAMVAVVVCIAAFSILIFAGMKGNAAAKSMQR
ncbi:SdpI family protein [Prescottella equi]